MGTADRVRQILSTKGLTLSRVSERSAEMFGRSSPFFIPKHLYFNLAAGHFGPSIQQLVAFSRLSGYRLSDWMAAFGFWLDDIPRLQLTIPWRRTVLLDSSVYDEAAWTPWFTEGFPEPSIPPIAPLGQLLKRGAPRRLADLLALNRRRFLYAKVGEEDALAFPTLAPGSIARVDTERTSELSSARGPAPSRRVSLVENGPTLYCGHIRAIGKNRISISSMDFPFRELQLTLGQGVRILGLIDAELRPFGLQSVCEMAANGPALRKTSPLFAPRPVGSLKDLVRWSRIRVGLSFREASNFSRSIADTLGDPTYFAATGTLSDYESLASPPRHVQKIISLCILYSIEFWSFLRACGLGLDTLGSEPIADEMIGRARPPRNETSRGYAGREVPRAEFLTNLIDDWKELPLFLRNALPALARLKDFSLSDTFWVGGNLSPVHPCLAGATLVAINRRVKTPERSSAKTAWDEPLHILLKRDGSYLCGSCALEGDVLVVHPHSGEPHRALRLRNRIDAEVTGQVTLILRRLSYE